VSAFTGNIVYANGGGETVAIDRLNNLHLRRFPTFIYSSLTGAPLRDSKRTMARFPARARQTSSIVPHSFVSFETRGFGKKILFPLFLSRMPYERVSYLIFSPVRNRWTLKGIPRIHHGFATYKLTVRRRSFLPVPFLHFMSLISYPAQLSFLLIVNL